MATALAWFALVVAAGSAPADRAPCSADEARPRCHVWTATVKKVSDGDTITADIRGDRTRRPARIRLTGIQAMELTRYARRSGRAGECHGVDAADRLETLIAAGGNRVRLAALDPASRSGARLRRHVSVRHEGAWLDAGALLLEEGLALWLASNSEWAWNGRYSRLAEEAASRKVGIWDGRSCGTDGLGAAANSLRLKVKWNADGNDAANLNGEWVRITNADLLHPVPLAGWWFRDSNLRRYTFPSGVIVPPGGAVAVHVGRGRDDLRTLHWNLGGPVFDNATSDRRQMGDGGYLFDPRGNLRAHVQYPCRTNCPEPLAGKVEITAHSGAPEYIRLRNISNETISLSEYEVERAPWFYEFGLNAMLLPGQTLDLYMQRAEGLGAATARTWDQPRSGLPDKAGVVTLRNPRGAPVVCDAWGGERCPDA